MPLRQETVISKHGDWVQYCATHLTERQELAAATATTTTTLSPTRSCRVSWNCAAAFSSGSNRHMTIWHQLRSTNTKTAAITTTALQPRQAATRRRRVRTHRRFRPPPITTPRQARTKIAATLVRERPRQQQPPLRETSPHHRQQQRRRQQGIACLLTWLALMRAAKPATQKMVKCFVVNGSVVCEGHHATLQPSRPVRQPPRLPRPRSGAPAATKMERTRGPTTTPAPGSQAAGLSSRSLLRVPHPLLRATSHRAYEETNRKLPFFFFCWCCSCAGEAVDQHFVRLVVSSFVVLF